MENSVVIISALRTAIGTLNGSLSTVKAKDLGSCVIKNILQECKVDAKDVDEVILGQVLTAGQGQNPARQAAIAAGLPVETPAYGINMLCGSGLKAVALGMQAIKCGDAKIVLAGGQENMSQAMHAMHCRGETKFGDKSLVDTMLCDGLIDAFGGCHMGITAENVAERYSISRLQQDEFAVASQNKCSDALIRGYFQEEVIAVPFSSRKGVELVTIDEYPRAGCTVEGLAKLRPAFKRDGSGTVTAANASGLNDGAAAVLLMREKEAAGRGLSPLARVVSHAEAGVEPALMGMGPVPAIRIALQKAGWGVDEVDLYEINEAFASQSVAVVKELAIDKAKVNVSGGAIALGHPIGASGARILVTLIHALKRLDKQRGVAALCVGGGMGVAMCVERC